jgi:hypothetical protein
MIIFTLFFTPHSKSLINYLKRIIFPLQPISFYGGFIVLKQPTGCPLLEGVTVSSGRTVELTATYQLAMFGRRGGLPWQLILQGKVAL